MTLTSVQNFNIPELLAHLREKAQALGFSQIGIATADLSEAEPGLLKWLEAGFHGGMSYMSKHGLKRARPQELVPGTLSIITARMDYLAPQTPHGWQPIEWARLHQADHAGISLYARGRDYHKVLRPRLARLAESLASWVGPFGYRVFSDSAPVLEVELATRSGLGWRGKHTLALNREAGSTFFLGEIFLDLALPPTPASASHCGRCSACLDICPTQAIVAPYRLDARRCIAYLTIEHEGAIPLELRPLIGHRIYGCDDCQLICPWNKFAQRASLPDFDVRAVWEQPTLLGLWQWSEAEFLRYTEGSAIRRIGFERWQRNLAVALGNGIRSAAADASFQETARQSLHSRLASVTPMVAEHITWALWSQPMCSTGQS